MIGKIIFQIAFIAASAYTAVAKPGEQPYRFQLALSLTDNGQPSLFLFLAHIVS